MSSVFDKIIAHQHNADEDYYAILGCDESSSEEQISAEYKARVLLCHPDKHPDDKEAHVRFSLLSKAKDTLLDPEKRKDYDKWRLSQIAMPYETWRSMGHVKTSMHWGVKKSQTALDHPDSSGQRLHNTQRQAELSEQDKRIQEMREKMRFTPREPRPSGWTRETSNPLLQKFRNYEI